MRCVKNATRTVIMICKSFSQQCVSQGGMDRDSAMVMTEVVSEISKLLEGQEAIPFPISVE